MFVREIKFVFQISYSLEHLRMAASIVFSSFQDMSVRTISKKKKNCLLRKSAFKYGIHIFKRFSVGNKG